MERISLKGINDFMANKKAAIAGISNTKNKFGNTLYKALDKKGFLLFPVHPVLKEYKGKACYNSLQELPDEVLALVICTDPGNTFQIVKDAHLRGIQNIWIQQGAETKESIEYGKTNNLNMIYKQCLMMYAEPVRHVHKFHKFCNKLFKLYPI